MSKGCGGDSENALWKIGSSFGNVTVEPAGTAMTCGRKVLFLCWIAAFAGGRRGGTIQRFGVDHRLRRLRGAARLPFDAAAQLLGERGAAGHDGSAPWSAVNTRDSRLPAPGSRHDQNLTTNAALT